ncbi:hypothetical protein AAVH_07613 [Aphelenchoides avenae]|nr:hypothetical protein AAVH_07613 [Aphelenchus avenae]
MNFARGMKELHELVSQRIEREAEEMKTYYDKQNSVEKTAFVVSDRVFVFNPNIVVDKHSSKLTPQWEGPFRILELSENSALVRFDITGTLLDFSATCSSHKHLRLSAVTTNLSTASRALFFVNNSPLASTDSFEKPTEESLIRVMVKLTATCKERSDAFAKANYKKLVYSTVDRQADLKVLVAERVRAELDSKKSLRGEPVLVLGGDNAQLLADFLGATFVEASTVPSLRSFFEGTHLQGTVLRIFVWLDIDNEQFLLAQQSQLVPALRDIIATAAKWSHVQFVVLPVPYAHSLLPVFEAFMEEFNKTSVNSRNVLWLNDSLRVDGVRFAHSLGSNAFVTYWTAVNQKGHVSRKSIRAALRFLRQLKPSLVPEDVDLSDPVKPEHASPSGPSSSQQSTSSSPALHGVYRGKVQKHHREDNSARGAPLKRGGGGGRGQWNNNRRGQGDRRNCLFKFNF